MFDIRNDSSALLWFAANGGVSETLARTLSSQASLEVKSKGKWRFPSSKFTSSAFNRPGVYAATFNVSPAASYQGPARRPQNTFDFSVMMADYYCQRRDEERVNTLPIRWSEGARKNSQPLGQLRMTMSLIRLQGICMILVIGDLQVTQHDTGVRFLNTSLILRNLLPSWAVLLILRDEEGKLTRNSRTVKSNLIQVYFLYSIFVSYR